MWERCDPPPETSWESCDGADIPRSDIRERQEEFDTPTHEVQGASILRRPDAISLDYLTAHTLGPIAVADPSRGLVARVWKAWTPDGYEVRLAGANGAGNAWIDERVLFTIDDGGPPILELDIAFEQNGQPVVCLERATGVGGASEVWIWFYDPTVPGMVLQNFGPGRTPRALLDRPHDQADSDVCVFYVRDDIGRIVYRQQRDRYAVEIETTAAADENTYLEDAALTIGRRIVVIYSRRDPDTGTYQLYRLMSRLLPIPTAAEGAEPVVEIRSLSTEEVIRDAPFDTEALAPVAEIRSLTLRDLIILLQLSTESLAPIGSITSLERRDIVITALLAHESLALAASIQELLNEVIITIDRVLGTEALDPHCSIQSITLEAA